MLVLFIGGFWILMGPTPIISGTMTAGSLFAFLMYMKKLATPFRNFEGVVESYKEGLASAHRIAQLVQESERLPEAVDSVDVSDIDGSVGFTDLDLTYPGTHRDACARGCLLRPRSWPCPLRNRSAFSKSMPSSYPAM